MTGDLVFDAMEYIDDDLLEAVNDLRMRKMPARRHAWTRWAAVAACLVLLIGGGWRIGRVVGSDSAAMEDAAPEVEYQDKASACIGMSVKYSGVTDEITDGELMTAVYDILSAAFSDASVGMRPENGDVHDEAAAETAPAMDGDVGATEDRYGFAGSYEITVYTDDGEAVVYRVRGNTVRNTETGVSVTLSDEARDALMAVLDET